MKRVMMKKSQGMIIKVRMMLGSEENNNSREVQKNRWRGVVWEAVKICNIWRKIVSVVFCYI